MSDPKISVLMPVYNAEAFVERSVQSILNQTWRDFEFLIIDNASTDNSFAILQRWAKNDSRIRLLQNERNLGLVASLNRGCHEAHGKYIARMDADDASRPKRLELQIKYMEKHPEVGICGGQTSRHIAGRQYRGRYFFSSEECDVTLLFHSCFAHPAVMMKRSLFSADGYRYDDEFRQVEDYDLWARMLADVRGANLPEVLLDYYSHENQESGTNYQAVSTRRNTIRERVVRGLVPDATAEELQLHHRIGFPQDPFDSEELMRAERWLLRLIKANQASRRYNETAMRSVFAQRWALVCGHATQLGSFTMRKFVTSKLLNRSVSVAYALKLMVKCGVKKHP